MQFCYIKINDVEIPFKINSNKIYKNFRISFNVENGYMNVSKPYYLSLKMTNKIIKNNEKLIYKEYLKMLEEKKFIEEKKSRKWVTGEKILYRGQELEVVINEIPKNKIEIRLDKDKFIVNIKSGLEEKVKKENIVKAVKKFFKINTEILIYEKLNYWCKYTGIDYNTFKVKHVKTRWGSCVKSTKSLNFSSRLIMFENNVVDAVVVHELCHIKEANHSKKFWNIVYRYIPNYKDLNNWIKINAHKFEIE